MLTSPRECQMASQQVGTLQVGVSTFHKLSSSHIEAYKTIFWFWLTWNIQMLCVGLTVVQVKSRCSLVNGQTDNISDTFVNRKTASGYNRQSFHRLYSNSKQGHITSLVLTVSPLCCGSGTLILTLNPNPINPKY